MKTIVVISDLQMPYEDRRALRNVIMFLGEFQPDETYQIGDLGDYPAPSHWSAGTRAEYVGGVTRDSEYIKKHFMEPVRAVYDGPLRILKGNHDIRPHVYLTQRAPALAADDTHYLMENLLDFDGFGVTLTEPYHPIAPGWVAIHGHESRGMSQIAGRTAISKAHKAGASVVMGHTHRLAVSPESTGYGGRLKTLYGFEVGHLMDVRKAGYLKNGPANWQKGFGILYVDGNKVTPQAIPVAADGTFIVEGQRFGKTGNK